MKIQNIRLSVEVSEDEKALIYSSTFRYNIVAEQDFVLLLQFDCETSLKAFFKKFKR